MQSLEQLKQTLNGIGLVGERKAIALGGFGFWAIVFMLLGISLRDAPPELPELRAWAPTFFGLGACYTLGFFALAAEWFWARWFAVGLANSGVSLVVWGVIMTRQLPPQLLVFGIVHGLMAVCLLGPRMALRYEGREDWRKRFQLDEQGVARLRRSVTRAATSLPSLIVLALKPADDAADMLLIAAAASGALGIWALLRGRSFGLVAIAVAAASAVAGSTVATQALGIGPFSTSPLPLSVVALFAGGLLLAALAPFARPVAAFLAPSRR